MSLKVWLPLNGDLTQQGTSNITVTNNGATVNTSGKTGSCYAFNGSTGYIALSGSDIFNIFTGGTQQFSITMWVFHADATRAILFGDYGTTGGINFNIELSTGHAVRFYWGGSPDSYPSNATIAASAWSHIALTYDGTKIQSYINGIAKGSWTGTLAAKTKTSGEFRLGRDTRSDSTALNGRMNDFRIYDHCLSAAEVREISQGLVLHYKLDEPNPNMLLMTPKSYTPTTYCGYQLSLNENLIANQTYTLQLWDVTVEHSAKTAAQMNLCIYWGGGNVQLKNFNGTSNFKTLRDYYAYSPYLVATFTVTSSQASGNGATNAWLNVYNSVGWVSGTVNMHIGAWKLEKGNIATSWTPNITTIIEDSSGYNHNGILTSTASITSNTPRYSNSIYLSKVKINCTDGFPTGENPNFTISFWTKILSTITYVSYGDLIGIYDTGQGSNTFRLELCGSPAGDNLMWFRGPSGQSGGGFNMNNSSSSGWFTKDTWHHIVLAGDGINKKYYCYLDGNLCQTYNGSANSWQPTGQWYLGDTTEATAYFSDLRIYCTTLDANAIRQLYEVGAKIDNKQNLHTFELNEKGTGRELLAIPLTTPFNNRTNIYTAYNSNGEITLTGGSSIGSNYIPINPSGHTYYYDIDVSTDAGNVFYIGFERYDANKTSRSNSACVYLTGLAGSSQERIHEHYHGTVNLATDGVNPTDTIALRILNDWSGASGRKGTVHSISLREVSTVAVSKITKHGQVITDELSEMNNHCRFQKNGIIEANEIIEF